MLTLTQLATVGLSERAVRHRVAAGRLRRLHRGVYLTGPPTAEARWMAAVLVAGDGAALSHRSAAALWGLLDDQRAPVHVTVPARTSRARPGVEMHSGQTLDARDLTKRDGIPCTALPRTLIDLATQVDRRALIRAVDRAEALRVFDLYELRDATARHSGRRGVRLLGAVLADYANATITRSHAEKIMLAIVDDAGLPTPEVNAWVPLPDGGGYRPDLLWRDRGLIVEVDGRSYHARRAAFEHDRRRDRRLALAGFETRRYAASEIDTRPNEVAREMKAFVAGAEARVPAALRPKPELRWGEAKR